MCDDKRGGDGGGGGGAKVQMAPLRIRLSLDHGANIRNL